MKNGLISIIGIIGISYSIIYIGHLLKNKFILPYN